MSTAAQADAGVSAQAHKYLVRFARDVDRIEDECLAEDIGIRKPMVKDKVEAAITNAYNRSDLKGAKRRQDQLEKKFAIERAKRSERKARKRICSISVSEWTCICEDLIRTRIMNRTELFPMSSTYLSVY